MDVSDRLSLVSVIVLCIVLIDLALALFMLRVYAIYENNWRVLAVLGPLLLARFSFGLVSDKATPSSQFFCHYAQAKCL